METWMETWGFPISFATCHLKTDLNIHVHVLLTYYAASSGAEG